MDAFEISINGRVVRTVSVGDFGSLTAGVMWTRIQTRQGPIVEECRVTARGLEDNEGDAVQWPHESIKLGDVVTIRFIEVDSADAPSQKMTREQVRNWKPDEPE